MATPDLDVIKDIPGYKVILKAILKSQIQQLVEQLAANTDEESVFLTASISDGTLSHLGSSSGKGFLEGHEDIKSQFLGYCLKNHHQKKEEEREAEAAKQVHQLQPRYPGNRIVYGRGGPPARRQDFRAPGMRHEPYPVSRPLRARTPPKMSSLLRTSTPPKPVATSVASRESIKIEPSSEDSSYSNANDVNSASVSASAIISSSSSSPSASQSLPSGAPCAQTDLQSNPGSQLSEQSDNVKLPQTIPSTSLENTSELDMSSAADSEQSGSGDSATSRKGDEPNAQTANTENANVNDNSNAAVDPNVQVKVEAISEADMELEITGVELASGMLPGEQDYGWNAEEQGTMGYDGSVTQDGVATNSQGFNTNQILDISHNKGSMRRQLHSCGYCSYATSDKSNFNKHRRRCKHVGLSKTFPRKVDKPVPVSDSKPVPVSAGIDDNLQVCDQCGKFYRTRYGLALHVKNKHAMKFKHQCSTCGKTFNQTVQYHYHCARHLKVSKDKCHNCQQEFSSPGSLTRHLKSCEGNEESKQFKCDICQAGFHTKSNLTCHQKGKHQAPRYTCQHCGSRFAWRTSLKAHVKCVHGKSKK